jgi:osmoprotectant transport system substrate-binding protein
MRPGARPRRLSGGLRCRGADRDPDPIPDERAQFEAVKKADEQQNGITEAYARQHNLNTNTDMTNFLKQHPDQAVFCVETEFASRSDGMPGVQKTYGFPTADIKTFGTGAIYSSIANGTCQFGEIFGTDGGIAGLYLKVLQDDKRFVPQYNAAVTLREDYLARHPQIRQVLEPVGKVLDNQQMIELCKEVDVDGRDPGAVARDWMVSKGFVKTNVKAD